MKKMFLALSLSVLLMSCGDSGLDRALDGTWEGQVKTTDLNLLGASSENSSNDSVTYETLVFKIDKENVESYRSRDADISSNNLEVEIGTYNREDNVVTFTIKRHSCVGANDDHPTKRVFTYKFDPKDLSKLTFTFFKNKEIELTKLSSQEEDALEQMVANAETGCFSGKDNKFEKGTIQAPKKD